MTVEEALTLMFTFGMFILALLAFVVELIKTIDKK